MIGVFYGSSTGNTESLAKKIASELGVPASDVHDIARVPADRTTAYDYLLLGSPTWGLGDLLDDWYNFLGQLKKMDLTGKKVGVFGCGDSAAYPDTFCDALGIIREDLAGTGCAFVGDMDATGYPSTGSLAFKDGRVLGLAVDDSEPDRTEQRMNAWIEAIKSA